MVTTLLEDELEDVVGAPAAQQPDWSDDQRLPDALWQLAARDGLVSEQEIGRMRASLAEVAAGRAGVLQAGDCAESTEECGPGHVARKAALVTRLAATMGERTGAPVLPVGRIAGQFAKPRSKPVEQTAAGLLPAYRGPMVNAPGASPAERAPDPRRMVDCVDAAARVMGSLRALRGGVVPGDRHSPALWTSHEALVLDYELSMVRRALDGGLYLASTHWPWIGERTRDPEGAHVRLLSRLANPVACKLGPGVTPAEARELADSLDPDRSPGRLTFIVRMGAGAVADRLPPLVRALRAEGHAPIWMSDPMHGNTVLDSSGAKRRAVSTVRREVAGFRSAVRSEGGVPGGLHLEVAAEDVHECVPHPDQLDTLPYRGTSLCDPRLNPEQAQAVVEEFAGAAGAAG